MALTRVCHDVATEPDLEPLQGEQFRSASTATTDGARLDISASGFWGGRFERTFFDVQVLNPNVQSNVLSSLPSLYRRHERQKRAKYEQRIRDVERSNFCPLIWSTSGGAGPAATCFLKRLADKLSERTEEPYSTTMGWLRCRLGFALTRSAVMCLRGSRSTRRPTSLCSRASTCLCGRTVAEPAVITLIVLSTILVTVPFITSFTVPFFKLLYDLFFVFSKYCCLVVVLPIFASFALYHCKRL